MEPKTPKELYWAKMAGEDVTLPDPKTPTEHYMKEVAENGSSGGSGGTYLITFTAEDELGRQGYLDKSYNEILSAIESGKIALIVRDFSEGEASGRAFSLVSTIGYAPPSESPSELEESGYMVGGSDMFPTCYCETADGVLRTPTLN